MIKPRHLLDYGISLLPEKMLLSAGFTKQTAYVILSVRMAFPRFPDMASGELRGCSVYPEGGHMACAEMHAEQLHPRFMAEEVCRRALARHIRMRRSQAVLGRAWNALEYGLTLNERPDEAGAFFDYAEDAFIESQYQSDKALSIVNAQLGAIFMPAYRARFEGMPLNGRKLTSIHGSIAGVLETFDELYDPRGQDKYAGVKPELVTLALFARLRSFEWLAYPASPREENTNIPEFNHDSYVLRHGLKVPIQVKRKGGSGYDKTVAVVRFHRIMQRVNEERQKRTIQLWGNKRKATKPLEPLGYNDFASLIVREAKGQWLTEHECWLLELGSMAAITEVMEKERLIRAERQLSLVGGLAIAA